MARNAKEAEGSPEATDAERIIHTPVRVGSAAMPAPFALRAPPSASSPSAQVRVDSRRSCRRACRA